MLARSMTIALRFGTILATVLATVTGTLTGTLLAGAGAARAEGDQCVQLFIDRNKVYADAHYCFKTKEALAYFSNAGCRPGEPRLTAGQQRRVAEIQRAERQSNCRTR
jgi:YARHG domain